MDEKKPISARMLGSRLISTAIKLTTGVKINDPTSGMRLYSRKCIKEFAQEINYSTSTVIRFCRKLGFSGFPEFKYFLKNLDKISV